MAFNDIIDRTGADALIPTEVGQEILSNLAENFWLFKVARRLPNLGVRQRTIPVTAGLATAGFVTSDTGLKPTTDVSWDGVTLTAEEIAAIVPIPEAVLDDAAGGGYDIWGEVRPALEEAISVVITHAVLYGIGIPASWTTGLGAAGIVALATAASQTVSLAAFTDEYEAILGESAAGNADGVLALLEADGFQATAHFAHIGVKTLLRNARDANGVPIFPNVNEIDGAPVYYPNDGTGSSTYKMISGDWTKLVYAIRQDMTYKLLTEGVISDGAGNIVYNLPQQDMVALRVVMRLGFAAPNPINRMQETKASRCPWAVLLA